MVVKINQAWYLFKGDKVTDGETRRVSVIIGIIVFNRWSVVVL